MHQLLHAPVQDQTRTRHDRSALLGQARCIALSWDLGRQRHLSRTLPKVCK